MTTIDISDRNRQYKELMMSKNGTDFRIETLDKDGVWTFRMRSLSRDYLDSVGRRWVDGKFCENYRVS